MQGQRLVHDLVGVLELVGEPGGRRRHAFSELEETAQVMPPTKRLRCNYVACAQLKSKALRDTWFAEEGLIWS